MSTGLIILARYDSTRLPGKALRPLAGRALLGWVIDRARNVPDNLPLLVATSERELDDPIAAFAEAEGVALYRGSAEDVAGRTLAAAEAEGFDVFARISGDSPFFDYQLLGEMIARRQEVDLDLVTNVMPRSYPPGASCEVVKLAAMRRLVAAAREPEEREHVTLYFYRHPEQFRIENCAASDDRCAPCRRYRRGHGSCGLDSWPSRGFARHWVARRYRNPGEYMGP
jgi:spore coat polysaccharide biosynthesis protein SpsF